MKDIFKKRCVVCEQASTNQRDDITQWNYETKTCYQKFNFQVNELGFGKNECHVRYIQ